MNYINWKKSDILTLKKAVNQFNRRIKQLDKETNKLQLPEKLEFKEVKENIKTRNELNRILQSLRGYNKTTAKNIILKSGESISKWEYNVLKKQRNIFRSRLMKELKELSIPKKGEIFSKTELGSEKSKETIRKIEDLKTLETKKGEEFKRIKERIKVAGTYDYEIRKAEIFRNNFMIELEELKNSDKEFQKVYDYFEKIQNPIEFFKTTQRSNALQDFFVWYKNPEQYAGFDSTEELANYIINEYKEKEEPEIKKYRYTLYTRRGIEISSADNKQTLFNIITNSNNPDITNGYIIENK